MFSLIGSYFLWHYTEAFADIGRHIRNFLWFFFHFFSIPVLLKTFFAPWRRLGESYPKDLNLGGALSVFTVNSLMRLVGMILRLIMIVFGVSVVVLAAVGGAVFLVVWALLPVLAAVVFLSGIRLFFL
jgi:hypothetical protein